MANDSQSRTARRKQMKSSKKGTKKPKFKKIFMTLLTIALVLVIAIGGLFTYYISTAPKLDESQLSTPYSSKVYDMNDKLITDLAGAERRTKVSYDDLPPVLVDAVTATEDSRFFSHIGIDFRRILAAIWANVTGGFGAEGASTITQQVVKKTFLTDKKTLKRKVQEQYLAIKLDKDYSKERILEMYLNKIYYGSSAYGVAEAAKTYFGVEDLSKLTLPQAALLAGLPQRPSGYDPFQHPDLAKDRMNTVLSLMVQHNKITQEEADKAQKTKIKDMLVKQKKEKDNPYQAFIDEVEKEVKEKMDGADIYKDGLKIYTTLDPKAQETVQQALSSNSTVAWPDDKLQSAIAVTDTQTGAVRAIGGRRNYKKGDYNLATDLKGRQPGSTFKPLTAYGPAIQNEKWSTYHQIKDEPIDISGYQPENYNGQYYGWVSARYALSRSLNIPAIKTLNENGLDKAQKFAEGLGIKFSNDKIMLSDAIGGSSTSVTPMQMSAAYAAFGNEGVYNKPYTVRKVETNGETTNFKPKPHSAMNSYTAYMITSMLKTVMSEGTGTRANISGLPVAGKTGTTNSGKDITPDSWFDGYTTNYSVSIWTGYPENNTTNLSTESQHIPQFLFKSIMSQISSGKETKDFSKPDTVKWVGVEKGSQPAKLPSKYTPDSQIVTELFHVDNMPSKVSEQFQKLDPVQSLSASYSEESKSINVKWDYGDTSKVSFKVSVSVDGKESRDLTTTKDKSLDVSSVEPGSKYEFTVTAVSDDDSAQSSDPSSTAVETPAAADEKPDKDNNPDGDNNDQPGDNGNENSDGDQSGNNDGGNQNDNPSNDDSTNGDQSDNSDNGSSSDQGNTNENSPPPDDGSSTDGSGTDSGTDNGSSSDKKPASNDGSTGTQDTQEKNKDKAA
ncbi:PBP1A family penicillin-binding protein [Halobacillus rhizosphaerae]|uniref:PBP1A family penicillin-binding protein n=1 Tax=Halobacillus rhizosphaerae TaxID=3064889 RepID=UPI00398BB937